MRKIRGITLVELLVAIILFGLMAGAIWSVDTFARYHLTTSQKRVKMQNTASFVIDHMTKNAARAIGNVSNSAEKDKVYYFLSSGTPATSLTLGLYVDLIVDSLGNPSSGDGIPNTPDDRWIYYTWSTTGNNNYSVVYCSNAGTGSAPAATCSVTPEDLTISHHIKTFEPSLSVMTGESQNYLNVQVGACYDPAQANSKLCATRALPKGEPDNPSVFMEAQIKMPMVSTR